MFIFDSLVLGVGLRNSGNTGLTENNAILNCANFQFSDFYL